MKLSKTVCVLACFLAGPSLGVLSAQQSQSSNLLPAGGAQPSSSMTVPGGVNSAVESAKLHVYRQHRYAGSALAPSVVVDGTQVARVGNGRRVTIKLAPGSHAITSDDKSSSITIDAKAGQDYYIRVDEQTGFWKGHGRLTLVMPEQGSGEYKLEKPIEPDRKIAKELIEDDAE